MNKKNIVLVLIICFFLSVMAISVWGKNPDQSSRVSVTGLQIKDTTNSEIEDINESNFQEKIVRIDYDETKTITYYFSVSILPSDATDVSLTCEIRSGNQEVEIEELSYEKWLEERNEEKYQDENGNLIDQRNVHFFKITFTEQEGLTILFKSNRTDIEKRDYLLFVFEGTKQSEHIHDY